MPRLAGGDAEDGRNDFLRPQRPRELPVDTLKRHSTVDRVSTPPEKNVDE